MKKLLTLVFVFSISSLSAQLIIDNTAETYPLRGKCKYLLDTAGLSIHDIFSKKFSDYYTADWYPRDCYYWISFTITNTYDQEDFLLTIDQWQKAELYYYDGFDLKREVSGTEVAVSERPEALHRLLTFPIHQPKKH